jgi:hypothetical protein
MTSSYPKRRNILAFIWRGLRNDRKDLSHNIRYCSRDFNLRLRNNVKALPLSEPLMWLNAEATISGSHLHIKHLISHEFNSCYPYLHIRLTYLALQTGFPYPHVARLDSCDRLWIFLKAKCSYNPNITVCVYKRSIRLDYIRLHMGSGPHGPDAPRP